MQVRAICVQIAYHSKLEVSSLSGDFKNAHRSPAIKLNKSRRIPMTPRVTHARLPEGRHDFKLRAEGGVRLSELTDLTVGLIGSQW